MKSGLTLLLLFFLFQTNGFSQHLNFLKIDTIADIDPPYYSTGSLVTHRGTNTFHSFVYQNGVDNFREIMGNTKIHVRDHKGNIVTSDECNDTIAIRNILFKKDGGYIYVGRSMRHLKFKGLDTILPFGVFDQNRSFILETDENDEAISFELYNSIGAATLEMENDQLYFSDNINTFDSIALYRKDLSTGITTKLADIYTQQRNEELQILMTTDYIYLSGGYLGEVAFFGDSMINTGFPYNMFLAQYDKSGKLNWINIYEDATLFKSNLAPAPGQGVYYAAPILAATNIGGNAVNGPNWGSDFQLSRVDKSGNFLWTIECPEYKLTDFQLGAGDAIDSDPLYNVYLVGSARTGIQWNDSTFLGSTANNHLSLILKFDTSGVLIGHFSDTEDEFSMAKTIDVDASGEFTVSGYFKDRIGFESQDEVILAGFHNYIASFFYIILNNNEVKIGDEEEIKMYPNPNHTGEITIAGAIRKDSKLTVCDVFGRIKLQTIISQTDSKINLPQLNPGIYFVKIDGMKVEKLIVN